MKGAPDYATSRDDPKATSQVSFFCAKVFGTEVGTEVLTDVWTEVWTKLCEMLRHALQIVMCLLVCVPSRSAEYELYMAAPGGKLGNLCFFLVPLA